MVDLRAVLANCVEGKMLSSRVVLRMLSIPETTENSTYDGAGRVLTDLAKGEEGRNGKLRRVVCMYVCSWYACLTEEGPGLFLVRTGVFGGSSGTPIRERLFGE